MLTCNHKDGTIIVDIEWSCIVRAVCSIDVMTATVAEIPHELMVHITERITHEVLGINRVLYDFTPKPTGTVEFE